MTDELTVTDVLTVQQLIARRDYRAGVIRVPFDLLEQFGVTMQGFSTQGEFLKKGVFAHLQRKLLLPHTYVIRGIFCRYWKDTWEIVVESPDLPIVDQACEPPEIIPIYHFTDDGTPRLLKIKIEDRWQRTYSPDELTLERL